MFAPISIVVQLTSTSWSILSGAYNAIETFSFDNKFLLLPSLLFVPSRFFLGLVVKTTYESRLSRGYCKSLVLVRGTLLADCLALLDASKFDCNEARLSSNNFSAFAFSEASISLSYDPVYDFPSSLDLIPFRDLTALVA